MLARYLALILLLLVSACEPAPTEQVMTKPGAPVGQLSDSVVPTHYRLELSIDPSKPAFSGTTEIDISVNQAGRVIWLHGKDLEVTGATITQGNVAQKATYEQVLASGVSSLRVEHPLSTGPATLKLVYAAKFNSSSNALYSVSRDNHHYAATQFQPIAARQVFPSFDEPRFKVPFDISIIARTEDIVVTTTPETGSQPAGEQVRHEFKTTRPLPTYLLAFVVGPYDVLSYEDIPPNAIRQTPIPLRGIAARGQGEKMHYALSHTAGLLSLLEEYFGIPYPYEKIDLIATPAGFGGAMENVGAIIYDEWLMLLDENSAVSQQRAFFVTHAHELAHMWFGNLVTPDWWTDIWLNESFATWISYKITADYWPEGSFENSLQRGALYAMKKDSLQNAREVREVVTENDRITDSFDGITYQKGGGVLGMIEHYAGEENFRAGIRHHMTRFADSTANAPQFMASLAEGAELSEIEPIFASFINQAGVPLVDVSFECDAEPRLSLEQKRHAPLGSKIDPDSATWQLPVCISKYAGGVRAQDCYLLTEKQQTFAMGGRCPDFVFPNANGSGYYHFTMAPETWQQLIENSMDLSSSEALALLSSLDAAFKAGSLSGSRYLNALARLVMHRDWEVADDVTGYLEEFTDLLPAEDLPLLEKAFQKIVAPRYAQALVNGPQILNDELQRFMMIAAKDPVLRAPLAGQAAAYIGFETDPDTTSVNPGQLETILSIGVQDLGEAYFDKLLPMAIASQNPAFRGSALGALARVEDPVLISKLQAAIKSGSFQGTEATSIIFRQMARAASRPSTYAWLKSEPVAILKLLPETFRPTIAPAFANSLCSNKQVAEWQAILAANSELIPGYERSIDQVVEDNQLCAALRASSRQSILQGLQQISAGLVQPQ